MSVSIYLIQPVSEHCLASIVETSWRGAWLSETDFTDRETNLKCDED